jgi:hypothetical protein
MGRLGSILAERRACCLLAARPERPECKLIHSVDMSLAHIGGFVQNRYAEPYFSTSKWPRLL